MARDRVKEVHDQAASTLLNIRRDFNCEAISKGLVPPDVPKDAEGYLTVSFHMAGMRSAWVMQSRLRKRYPELDTRVVAVVDKNWQAEVRVKKREAETDEDRD